MEIYPIVPILKYPLEVALSISLYGAATKVCQTGVWSLCVCMSYSQVLLPLLVVHVFILGSDPPPHPLDKTQPGIDVCNVGPDIYVLDGL